MAVVVTFTLTNADAARIQAAATAAGAADAKSWVVALTIAAVKQYEQGRRTAQALVDYANVTPVNPT